MKQIMVQNYGNAGRSVAHKFVKNSRCQAAAHWVQSKNPLVICTMEKISAKSPVTWTNTGRWWSSTLSVEDKARKDGLI